MMLFHAPADLEPFVPNVLRPAMGEASLFEKIGPHLTLAEHWVERMFTGEETLATVATLAIDSPLFRTTVTVVVCQARWSRFFPTREVTPVGRAPR